MESVADREREKARLFSEVVPEIVESLAHGKTAIEIAQGIEDRCVLDSTEAYRWVLRVEDDLETYRRRFALPGIVLLWIGGALLATAILLLVFRGISIQPVVAALGAFGSFFGSWLILRRIVKRAEYAVRLHGRA